MPASTAELLRSGRLLTNVAVGRLQVLFEGEAGAPVSSLAGQTLLFGLRLVNPYFDNVTAPVLAETDRIPLYQNSAVPPGQLDAPRRLPHWRPASTPTRRRAPTGR